jgi:hypothetical protein
MSFMTSFDVSSPLVIMCPCSRPKCVSIRDPQHPGQPVVQTFFVDDIRLYTYDAVCLSYLSPLSAPVNGARHLTGNPSVWSVSRGVQIAISAFSNYQCCLGNLADLWVCVSQQSQKMLRYVTISLRNMWEPRCLF